MFEHRPGSIARFVGLAAILSLLGFSSSAAAQECDRECLTDLMTRFIDALVAHDPSTLPLAEDVRYTEDSRRAELGQGIWQSVPANGGFRQDYVDTRKQVIGSHVLLHEDDVQVLYSVLLHVDGMQIAGIETLVQRVGPEGRLQPTELGAPIRGMNDPVPDGMRNSREEMVRIA